MMTKTDINDGALAWQASNMQIDAMEAAEGKIPHGHSSESTSDALPVANAFRNTRTGDIRYALTGNEIAAEVMANQHEEVCIYTPSELAEILKSAIYAATHIATPQIENALPNEQKILPHIVIQDSNENGLLFKVVKQIGEDYLSKIVAENAADKLNMLRG
jgi:hypothetical protein